MARVNITYELRDKLDKEWYSEYVQLSYPFFMWAKMKYNARMVWKIPDHPFAFEFETQKDADKFVEKWL